MSPTTRTTAAQHALAIIDLVIPQLREALDDGALANLHDALMDRVQDVENALGAVDDELL